MHICCTKNNGIDYLQVQESYYESINGKSKQRKRVIKNLGPLSRFDDGEPNFLYRLRASFREGKPIIPELNNLIDAPPPPKIKLEFDPNELSDYVCAPKNIGYFLPDALYDALGIYDVLNKYKSNSKLEYDLNGIAKLLVFGRMLWPDSKLGTFEHRDRNLFGVTTSTSEREVYRALDCLSNVSDAIQKRMNTKIRATIGRNTEVCFYDVTNYYFEIDFPDGPEDLRKRGVSKEHRVDPITSMGLFMDSNGIPVSMSIFPGNTSESLTLQPTMRDVKASYGLGRLVVVADKGLNTSKNIDAIINNGDGFIFSQVLRGTKGQRYHEKLFNGSGWVVNKGGSYRYKLFEEEYTGINMEGKKEIRTRKNRMLIWQNANGKRSWKKPPVRSRTMLTALKRVLTSTPRIM